MPFAGDAVKHLAVGALELLPVALLSQHLVDALERFEEARVQIERFVEELDRAIQILELVAVNLRLREDVTRLDLGPGLELADGRQRVDHLLPLAGLLVELEQLVEQDVIGGLEVAGLLERLDRLVRVLLLVAPDIPNLVEDLVALLTIHHGVEDLALVSSDLLPIVRLTVDVDQRFERRTMIAGRGRAPSRSC